MRMDLISSRSLLAALAVAVPVLAGAQKLPDDCSSAAAPKQPVEASILSAWMISALVVRLWAGRSFLRGSFRPHAAVGVPAGSGSRASPGAPAAT
jgi:hypothetical protein